MILHYKPIYSGASSSLEKLMYALPKNTNTVELITTLRSDLSRIEDDDEVKIIRVGGGPFNQSGYLQALGRLRFAISVGLYNLFNPKYDILHCIGTGITNLPALLVAKVQNKRIVNKMTRMGGDDPLTIGKSGLGILVNKMLSRKSAHLIISEQLYSACQGQKNWHPENFYLIPNPVDIYYNSWPEVVQARVKNNSKMVFLYVGVIADHKGLDLLLQLMPKFKELAKLIVCGPVWQKDVEQSMRLIELMKEMPNVEWVGKLAKKQLEEKYLSANYLLFPTRREGLPNTVLESMSYGLPVVASLLRGVTDYLLGSNGERGVLVEENSFECWAEKIRYLLSLGNNSEEISTRSEAAFDWVKQNASSMVVADKVKNMYSELLNNS